MTGGPFNTVWADMGEAETSLLVDVLRAIEAAHTRLRERREAGRPVDHYAEHMAMTAESQLRAVLRLSPHLQENFHR